jgi:hypothetical protein
MKVYQSQFIFPIVGGKKLEVKRLFIKKNGYIIDIACSKGANYPLDKIDWNSCDTDIDSKENIIEIQVKDLALYTHWPQHTKEFWDLLDKGVVFERSGR